MPDSWETRWGTDPNRADAWEDPDGDGVPNIVEMQRGTDPHHPDPDPSPERRRCWQGGGPVRGATDPDGPKRGDRGGSDSDEDPDGDGLTNALEAALGLTRTTRHRR